MKVWILVDKNNRRVNNGFLGIFTYKSACEYYKINRELWFKRNQKKVVNLEIIERTLI